MSPRGPQWPYNQPLSGRVTCHITDSYLLPSLPVMIAHPHLHVAPCQINRRPTTPSPVRLCQTQPPLATCCFSSSPSFLLQLPRRAVYIQGHKRTLQAGSTQVKGIYKHPIPWVWPQHSGCFACHLSLLGL